jgi:hypothetical protein
MDEIFIFKMSSLWILRDLESNCNLDQNSNFDLYCLHLCFIHLMKSHLNECRENWNNQESIKTTTPRQLSLIGLMSLKIAKFKCVVIKTRRDLHCYRVRLFRKSRTELLELQDRRLRLLPLEECESKVINGITTSQQNDPVSSESTSCV